MNKVFIRKTLWKNWDEDFQLLPVLGLDLGFPTRNGRPLYVRTDYGSDSGACDRISELIAKFNESNR
jgi:hypothetical protein